jgi:hypothetical protein
MVFADRLCLPFAFDPARLEADLERLAGGDWIRHFVTQNYEGDWSVIALRAADPHAAGMQDDLRALMQQDAEHGSQKEDRHLLLGRPLFGLDDNMAAVTEQETRNIWNPQQKTVARGLPGRAALGCILQCVGNRAHRDGHIRRLQRLIRRRDQPRQHDLTVHTQTGDAIEPHALPHCLPAIPAPDG